MDFPICLWTHEKFTVPTDTDMLCFVYRCNKMKFSGRSKPDDTHEHINDGRNNPLCYLL